ncbi:hypothetical protein [Streptomyces hydrogenans]|uniref:hypothetical protein n=1 Tax=Streptomyces hydrogenans TaxID=1873719 RepID=UPI003807CD7E
MTYRHAEGTLPMQVIKTALEHAVLLDLGDPANRTALASWKDHLAASPEADPVRAAVHFAPDLAPELAWALRWLLGTDPDAASHTFELIIHFATNELGLPPQFTAGVLVDNIRTERGTDLYGPIDLTGVHVELTLRAAATRFGTTNN